MSAWTRIRWVLDDSKSAGSDGCRGGDRAHRGSGKGAEDITRRWPADGLAANGAALSLATSLW